MPGPSLSSTAVGTINGSASSSNAAGKAKPTGIDTSPTLAPTPAEEEAAELQTTVMLVRNNAALDAQLEDRPLAKKEKELQEHEIQEHQQTEPPESAPDVKEPSPKPEKIHKKALLKNDDYELVRIGKVRYCSITTCNPIISFIFFFSF